MNKITLPLLSLELNINKIAFTIFGMPIYWYAILIVSSIILALILCKKQDGKYGIKYEDIVDLSIILIPISFICARLYYVIFNITKYSKLIDIINLKDGGLAIYGGIIGGAITAYIFCKKRKINFLDLLDYIVPFLALGQAIGRWGNFINVEAYGTETNLPWKMGIQTETGMQYVHPTFLYESIATFIIFIILMKMSKTRKYTGQITFYYIAMYSFIRAIIENLRIDSLMLYNLRISRIFVDIIVCNILYNNIKKGNKTTENQTKSQNRKLKIA